MERRSISWIWIILYCRWRTKTIKANFGLNSGSEVTLHFWGQRIPERNFKNTVHEIGHWLIGSNHPYTNSSSNDDHKVWGILTRGDDGICANTYERERLAWVNPTEVTGNILNAPFQDYLQYGTAYKYHPSNGATDEYFYFENHQKLNVYDNATNNPNDKGIFVLHQQGIYSNSNNIRIKTSNGQWDWENTGIATCFGDAEVPKFKPVAVNRAGRNNKDKLLTTNGGADWLFYLDDPGIADWPDYGCGGWLNGEGMNNSFNLSYNNVFSNYSNPWARRWTNDATNNFTMEIIDQNGSVVNARFYLTSPLDGKPAKPQELRLSKNGSNNPVLTWAANTDPDLLRYRVYKKLTLGAGGQQTTYTTTTSTTYTDNNFSITTHGYDQAEYWIVAEDNTNLLSVESEHMNTSGTSWIQWKQAEESEPEIRIDSYKLSQCFLNPFNPTTQINYAIKEAGFVTLKVFDLLGNEVAALVNEPLNKGNYAVNFNASNLSSGIYIYTVKVNDFTASHKMILMK